MIYFSNILISQHLQSARGVGISAFTTLTKDLGAIDWNPAGLSYLMDWEFSISNYLTTQPKTNFNLQYIAVGKKISDNHSTALSFLPGKILEFFVPTTLVIYDSLGNKITTKYDREISYRQNYSLGYSYRLCQSTSIGLSARLFESKLTDINYLIDTNDIIQSEVKTFLSNKWTIDFGILSKISETWSVGFVGKNILIFTGENFPPELNDYKLNLSKLARLGIAYEGFQNILVSIEGDTKKKIRSGFEWSPLHWLQLRGGLYAKIFGIDAIGLGVGFKYEPVDFDLGYINFISNNNRGKSVDINTFKNISYSDLDYTPFTTDRIMFSVSIHLGKVKEPLAKIEDVVISTEIFPAMHQIYAFKPIGKAVVRNISNQPINLNLGFYIPELMYTPTKTKSERIFPNEQVEIQFNAVFNEKINSIKALSIYEGTVYVETDNKSDYDDSYQTRIIIRGRNDWNGDVSLLRYFITPDEANILKFTRLTLNQYKSHLDTTSSLMLNFEKAKIMFNEFASQVSYVNDPQTSRDFVQYPSETLSLKGGDCEDLTVCYSSLLMSIGVPTALVDVRPIDSTETAHIYMMFDTGIEPVYAHKISENSKRYVIRKNTKGIETVWIPIETTAVTKGFEDAWNIGAEQYFDNAEIKLGIIKGWMKIVDLDNTF